MPLSASTAVKLKRFDKNPIFAPDPASAWEGICVSNPGAWYDGEKVQLLYRAGPDNKEHPIYLGLAESRDGLHFTKVGKTPVFGPSEDGFDAGCIEDPRIIKFGDTYFVTYAARMFPPGRYWQPDYNLTGHNPPMPPEAPIAVRGNLTRSGLAATKDFKKWHRLGPITSANIDNRDVIIFPEQVNGQFVMLHRPYAWTGPAYGCEKPSIWMSFSDDMLCWKEDHLLAQPHFWWESRKIGGSTPPLRTKKGWLTLYHGVDDQNVYRVGAMMLDLENPMKIIGRTPEPILEPEADYEKVGLVKNVVFPCGNVIIKDQLFVYYGGADKVCCVATSSVDELVDYTMANPWKE